MSEVQILGDNFCNWVFVWMILLSISLSIVTKKLLNVSVIILELDSVLLFMFMDLICLWEFVLRLIGNRSNPIPGFFVFVIFKIMLTVF